MIDLQRKSKEFPRIRELLHQRPTVECLPNSIVRHRSWWLENKWRSRKDNDNAIDIGALDASLREIKEYEDFLVEAAFNFLKDTANKIIEHESSNSLMTRDSFYFISGYDSHSVYNRYFIYRFDNIISVKHIVDANYISKSAKIDYDRRKNSRIIEELSSINSIRDRISQGKEISDDDLKIRQSLNYLNQTYWRAIDTDLKFQSAPITPVHALASEKRSELWMFADFRSTILPGHSSLLGTNSKDEKAWRDNNSSYNVLKDNWVVFKALEGDDYGNRLQLTKSVITNTVQNEDGIFISALGQTDRVIQDDKDEWSKVPSSYILFCRTNNRHQIGRMVDNIDRLGVNRLISLRSLDGLKEAGRDAQRLGALIDFADVNTGKSGYVEKITEELDNIGREIDGGIYQRISETKQQAEGIRELISVIGMKPLRGFESYREFLSRRLALEYQFVEQLDRDLKRARARAADILVRNQLGSIENLFAAGWYVEWAAATYYIGSMLYAIPLYGLTQLVPSSWLGSFPFDDAVRFCTHVGIGYVWWRLRGKAHRRTGKSAQP
ncbi:MAG: hypothetical protein AAGC81_17220 [Pseudomonadota bacterium]